jgi:hypothetical protein
MPSLPEELHQRRHFGEAPSKGAWHNNWVSAGQLSPTASPRLSNAPCHPSERTARRQSCFSAYSNPPRPPSERYSALGPHQPVSNGTQSCFPAYSNPPRPTSERYSAPRPRQPVPNGPHDAGRGREGDDRHPLRSCLRRNTRWHSHNEFSCWQWDGCFTWSIIQRRRLPCLRV